MTLYFDYRVRLEDVGNTINAVEWHSELTLLAVSSHSQESGGCVNICDELVSKQIGMHITLVGFFETRFLHT